MCIYVCYTEYGSSLCYLVEIRIMFREQGRRGVRGEWEGGCGGGKRG